jgi:hypothetical protein
LPLTTVLLVSFRADWLRREEAMKTARSYCKTLRKTIMKQAI